SASASNRGIVNAKGFLFIVVTVLSLVVSLTAEAALTKVSQPSNITKYEGQRVSLTVKATSNRSIRYYWYKNGQMLSIKTPTISFAKAVLSNAATYSCLVTDGVKSFRCKPFTLTVKKKVRISKQPASKTVEAGKKVSLTVTATGATPFTYQWYKNGKPISGAKSNTLVYSRSASGNAGKYYVVVKNGGTTATSSIVSLKVVAAAASGSAKIAWKAPTTRKNGKPLAASEIAGYTLYHSKTGSGNLTKLASLASNELSIRVNDLAAGNHYFALSTRDKKGLQSSMSPVITVKIP
ncbi:MAG TPA: immunoglobulin domain-containing protein, partial [Dongiaceae bacterium]|nr:immunoglobulin domain-containing protein [Dongiaceae bacterium]